MFAQVCIIYLFICQQINNNMDNTACTCIKFANNNSNKIINTKECAHADSSTP